MFSFGCDWVVIALFEQVVCDVAWVIMLFITMITDSQRKKSDRGGENEKIVWVIWAIVKTNLKIEKLGNTSMAFTSSDN